MRAGAIIVAAGSGTRFGRGDKAFAVLAGLPLLAHSIAAFGAVDRVRDIVVVLRAEDMERFAEAGIPTRAVAGGARRQDSARAGFHALRDECDVVLVHDAARPLVHPAMIQRCLAALEADPAADGVVPVLPVVDTLKRVAGGAVRETVDRASLVRAQTPQAFRRAALARAYDAAHDDVTDDAQLVERAGGRVVCVDGDPANIKITYPEDLIVAEALLRDREAAAR